MVGLDVGVKLVVADSNGNKVEALKLEQELTKLRKRAKQLSRKKKGSNNRFKATNPKFTSQTCPKCGYISKENRLSQSKFVCQKCSYTNNADVVGALNILDRGIHGINASLKIAV
jgi:transposase